MTDLDTSGSVAAESPPDWRNLIYEVFNLDYSVGVACDRSGRIVGLHLSDDVWEHAENWLAAEILRVARLAHVKSQVGRRAELLYNGAMPRLADSLGLPTEAEYNLMEKAEFGEGV
ncbi:hypothetical protein AB4305_30700 [Nocardia sp. 2YAB30]|uniref:hypothetical protein n=1 Tax=Nocardia sp. 2YAB30 TaxID=3233022 RepID=UPI003F9AC27F